MTIPYVQITGDSPPHRRRLAETVNKLLAGYHNEVHSVTMDPAAAFTRYPAGALLLPRITPSTLCVATPIHINAALLMYGGAAVAPNYFFHTCSVGYVTFYHASTGTANQVFTVLLFGD